MVDGLCIMTMCIRSPNLGLAFLNLHSRPLILSLDNLGLEILGMIFWPQIFWDSYFWPQYSRFYILGLDIHGSNILGPDILSLKVLFPGLRSFVSAATTSATPAPRTLLFIPSH